MSNLGHIDAADKGKERKVEAHSIHVSNPGLAQHARLAEIQDHLFKSAALSGTLKPQPVVSRPIAPAPGGIAVAAAVNMGGKIIGTPQHLVPKGTAISTALEAISLQQHQQQQQQQQQGGPTVAQTVAVNLSTQQAASSQAVSQALHITMTTVSSQSLHSLTLPAALGHASGTGLVHPHGYQQVTADKDKSRVTVMTAPGALSEQDRIGRISMESLIRGAVSLPQAMQKVPAQVSLALAQTQGQQQGTSHVVSNLPPSHIPRGAAAASALAATKVNAVATPILRTQAVPTASLQGNNPLLPTIAAQWKKPSTPPVTHVITTTAGHHQAELQRQGHIMTPLSAGSPAVQISGIPGRQVLSQVQNPKGSIAVSQSAVPQAYAQAQKVVVSQAGLSQTVSQLLTPSSGGPTLVNVSASKITALNLAPQAVSAGVAQGGPTAQKILSTQVSSLPTPAQVTNLAGHTLSLGQTLPRGQKIVVPQASNQQSIPPGAVVVNTAPKLGPGVNVGQALQRPQKVLMSHVGPSGAVANSVPITIATMPKAVGIHGSHSVSQVSSVTTVAAPAVSAPNVTSLPLAKKLKVPAQRATGQPQVAMTINQHHQTDHPQVTAHREVISTAPAQAKLALGGQPTPPSSSTLQNIQASWLQTGMRASSGNTQSNLSATGPSNLQAVPQVETRTNVQERSALPAQPMIPIDLPANYYQCNLVTYQTQLGTASSIRPGLVAGQPPAGLAVTLQAGTPVVTTVTGSQAGVRINPSVMVSVDPSPHGAISMATAQFPSTKPLEVPHVSTTTVTVAQSGPIAHPTNLISTTMSHGPHSTNQQQGVVSQPTNASPRPSILRKRPHEGERVMIVKKNLLSSVNAVDTSNSATPDSGIHHPGVNMASPKPSMPCDPTRENSQSSTDTASSTESTPQSGAASDVKVKQEPLDVVENGAAAGLAMFGQLQNNIEASPRKKPRKQQLNASEDLKDGGSSDEELDTLAQEDIKQELEWMTDDFIKSDMKEYIDEEGVRWTRDRRRPPINLLNHYTCNWKSKNNHFQRHQDVKVKEERRPTVNELANQKGIHQKASGWKVYHLAAQLEELMDMERDVFRSMSVVQECIAPKHIAKNPTMEDDISMVHELTQGNIQRCQLVMDQLDEAKSSMVKVLDHKKRIVDIINKHHSKRSVKKKERP